jgi:hypothetical protein
MKIKSIIAMASLFSLAIVSTAFIQKPIPVNPAEFAVEKESFLSFLSQFKKVELPYSIGLNDLEGYQVYRDIKSKPAAKSTKKAVIKTTQFIPESQAGKFSRMGPPELVPVVRFYPNDKMVAVVYSSKQRFGGDINIAYQLVLYDLKGNILQKQKEKSHFSGAFNLAYSSLEKTMTCAIDAAGHISQSEYENVWKKAVHEHGYTDNKLIDFKPGKTTYLALDSKGNLNETKYGAVASRARP